MISRLRIRSLQRRRVRPVASGAALRLLLGLLGVALAGCAHGPAVGGGGRIYEISIESIDGLPVTTRGSSTGLFYVVQVGDRLATVWPVTPALNHDDRPIVLLEADAQALHDGILIERTWRLAVAHEVTDDELAAGAALVYVPGLQGASPVELRFRPVPVGQAPRGPVTRGDSRATLVAGDGRRKGTATPKVQTPRR